MKTFLKVLGIYLAFLVQSTIFENIQILSCSPDILVVAIIISSVTSSVLQASLIGGGIGLVSDALFGTIFGVNTLSYMYLGFFVSIAISEKNSNSPLLMAWITFVCVTVMEVVVTLFKSLFGYGASLTFLGANIFVKGVFGALVALLFVLVRQFIKTKKEKKKNKTEEEMA